MTVQHLESLYPDRSEWSSHCEQLRQASTLPDLVWIALQLGLLFARLAVEQELHNRAIEPTKWPACPSCQGNIRVDTDSAHAKYPLSSGVSTESEESENATIKPAKSV
jgi:hypothetical protein